MQGTEPARPAPCMMQAVFLRDPPLPSGPTLHGLEIGRREGRESTLPQGFASSEELDDNSSPERPSIQVNGWRRQQWLPTPYRRRANYSVHQHPTISKRFQRHRLPWIKPIFTISNTGTDTAERSITKTHRTPPAPCKKRKEMRGNRLQLSTLCVFRRGCPCPKHPSQPPGTGRPVGSSPSPIFCSLLRFRRLS